MFMIHQRESVLNIKYSVEKTLVDIWDVIKSTVSKNNKEVKSLNHK